MSALRIENTSESDPRSYTVTSAVTNIKPRKHSEAPTVHICEDHFHLYYSLLFVYLLLFFLLFHIHATASHFSEQVTLPSPLHSRVNSAQLPWPFSLSFSGDGRV